MIGGKFLSPYSSRIDLLSPILCLESETDSFVLDLHYSLDLPRFSTCSNVVIFCNELILLIEKNYTKIASEVEQRLPNMSAFILMDAWTKDLKYIREFAMGKNGEERLTWCRDSKISLS